MPYESTSRPENVELAELLARRGVDRETLGTLFVLPLVHVAWADGRVDPKERRAIMDAAESIGVVAPRAKAQLEERLAVKPSAEELEADLRLISLLLASIPEQLPVSVGDISELAQAIGEAAGGVFGLAFTLSRDEKDALEVIRQHLAVAYDEGWGTTLKALRADWQIDDWVEFEEPNRFDEVNIEDELLFTDPFATEVYVQAVPIRGGLAMGVGDLRRAILNEVMKGKPWGRGAAQARLLLDAWIRNGHITDTGRFWCEPPHARVYDVVDNIRFRLEGKVRRLLRGEQVVFAPSGERDSLLQGGVFKARSGSVQAGAFVETMVGVEPDEIGIRPMTDAAIEDLEVAIEEPVVYILLDTSGSMAGERLHRALDGVSRFIDGLAVDSGIQVLVRPFSSSVAAPLTPVGAKSTPALRRRLLERLGKLEAGGTTGLYAAVEAALDDLLRLVHQAKIPKSWLVVLSDGEDNVGLEGASYRGQVGEAALFARMRDFISAGALTYLPIAYGGHDAVLHLSQIAGPGTRVEVAYPTSIRDRLQRVGDSVVAAHSESSEG